VASAIAELWWVLFWGGLLVFVLVFGLFLAALLGRRRRVKGELFIALLGIGFPVVVLSALMVYAFGVGERIVRHPGPPDLLVEVVGQRWWWEVRYPGAERPVVTANEIHIPAGRDVEFAVSTRDVIHSFWVPNLGGKIDMIPGRTNRIRLRADRPGVFRGQCAEFCGAQHARMAFLVVAHPPAAFDDWLQRQAMPAAEPADRQAREGQRIFMGSRCIECHRIRGTAADGDEGPDLTHVGSRRTLAAGSLPNGRESLMTWIRANRSVKPGNAMPEFRRFDEEALAALAAYLEGLK
jgi:cytochrome c oxidase subunit 2